MVRALSRISGCILAALCLSLLLGTQGRADAREAPAAEPPGTGPAMSGTVPLSRFSAEPGPLRLRDVSDSADLFIPVASTARVVDATVQLRYTHSIALVPHRSYLAVRLNDVTVAQAPLNPQQPERSLSVRLPADLWRPGYNKLTLAAVQHYADRCEDPESPELWTELDLSRSYLTFRLRPLGRPYTLADLGGIFSPGLGGHGQVLLLTAPDDERLRSVALPLVAQALALRRQYAPLRIRYAAWREPSTGPSGYLPEGEDPPPAHVLVGTVAQLRRVLPEESLEGVSGPYVAIAGEGETVRLIVTGRSEEEVVSAARGLAEMDDGVNPGRWVSFRARTVSDPGRPLVRRQFLDPKSTYSFDQLGVHTTTVTGEGQHAVRVLLPVAADFYTDESARAEILLDFGYGAGVGPGSMMNIVLNGRFIHGVLFDAPGGAAFRGYRLEVPARLLVPGSNTLEFRITLRPQPVQGECVDVGGRHLMAQILGSSAITLPDGGHAAVQPDLALFASTGFPYVTVTRPEGGAVYLSSEALRGSALTLIGKLAQVSGAVTEGWRIKLGVPPAIEERAIVLAPPKALPEDLFANWSAAIGRTVRWPYRMINDIRAAEGAASIAAALDWMTGRKARPGLRGWVEQDADLGPLGVLMAFRSPAAPVTVTLVTAASEDRIAERVDELVQPELWSQIRGDLVAWDRPGEVAAVMQVADFFVVGGGNRWLTLRLLLSNNPWYWLFGVIGSSAVMALLSVLLLRRRRRASQPDR